MRMKQRHKAYRNVIRHPHKCYDILAIPSLICSLGMCIFCLLLLRNLKRSYVSVSRFSFRRPARSCLLACSFYCSSEESLPKHNHYAKGRLHSNSHVSVKSTGTLCSCWTQILQPRGAHVMRCFSKRLPACPVHRPRLPVIEVLMHVNAYYVHMYGAP